MQNIRYILVCLLFTHLSIFAQENNSNPERKKDDSDYQENYDGKLAEESKKYEKMFRSDMIRLTALGTLTKFIKKFEQADRAKVGDLELFFLESTKEERVALVKEIENLKDVQMGVAGGKAPFEFGTLQEIKQAKENDEKVSTIGFYSSKKKTG
ncbi:hypothetical protein N9N67_00090 [Bacteriovoracaceae bacterium]|nr:hypothetical protein [Bacteriovoracaceae bacterium]